MDRETRIAGLRDELIILDEKIMDILDKLEEGNILHGQEDDLRVELAFLQEDRDNLDEEYLLEVDAAVDEIINAHERGLDLF